MKICVNILLNILKYSFPISLLSRQKQIKALVLSILLYAAVIFGYFFSDALLGRLFGDVVAWLLGLFGTIVGLYSAAGIIMSVLRYCGLLK